MILWVRTLRIFLALSPARCWGDIDFHLLTLRLVISWAVSRERKRKKKKKIKLGYWQRRWLPCHWPDTGRDFWPVSWVWLHQEQGHKVCACGWRLWNVIRKSPGTSSSVSTELLAQVCEESRLKWDLMAKLGREREWSPHRSFLLFGQEIDSEEGDAGFIVHH